MAIVHYCVDRPAQRDGNEPAQGVLECRPTLRRYDAHSVVLPAKFTARLVNGIAILDLAQPDGVTWCWEIVERCDRGVRRFVTFADPDDPDQVLYADDLTDVDPDTLDPATPPSPAWLERADQIQEAVDAKADTTALEALAVTVASKVDTDDVDGLVDDALDTYAPGTELAYAEIHSTSPYSPYSNTQTSVASTASNVTGLTISFTGTGRPVIITLAIGIIWHSVANTKVSVGLAVNGVIATAPGMIGSVYAGAAGSSGGVSPPVLTRRIATIAGQTYTVDARVSGAVAGTTTVGITNTPYVPSSLRAVAC